MNSTSGYTLRIFPEELRKILMGVLGIWMHRKVKKNFEESWTFRE
jgi:hypothetical protein